LEERSFTSTVEVVVMKNFDAFISTRVQGGLWSLGCAGRAVVRKIRLRAIRTVGRSMDGLYLGVISS
jgi:hypothetical protein